MSPAFRTLVLTLGVMCEASTGCGRNPERSSPPVDPVSPTSPIDAQRAEARDQLPELTVFDDGLRPVSLRSLSRDQSLVLVLGCLTDEAFRAAVPSLEALAQDYQGQPVAFYFVYVSLAFPEEGGYVQPFSAQERNMHLVEAKRTLGTQIPWLADSMSNDLLRALGGQRNLALVVAPGGRVVTLVPGSQADVVRQSVAELVGPAPRRAQPGPPAALLAPVARGPLRRARVVSPMVALVSKPRDSPKPYYAKLRVEADEAALNGSAGALYLGFHLDPLYESHWDNRKPRLSFRLFGPQGAVFLPEAGEAPPVRVRTDTDPREFIVSVQDLPAHARFDVVVSYQACSPEGCEATEQSYDVTLRPDREAGVVLARTGPSQDDSEVGRLMRFDRDRDGRLSAVEAPPNLRQGFADIDQNRDGFLDGAELGAFKARTRQRKGGRSSRPPKSRRRTSPPGS